MRAIDYKLPSDLMFLHQGRGRRVHIGKVEAFSGPLCGASTHLGWHPWGDGRVGSPDLADFYASHTVCPKCRAIMNAPSPTPGAAE